MNHAEFLSSYRAAHISLHKCWTAAVGKPGYDKKEWMLLDNTLNKFANYVAFQIGYNGPLIPTTID